MKVAVLSDIHANWQALEAVLDDLPAVDQVVCLGDVVGYGADPVRCLDHVRAQGWPVLVGNHDRAATDPTVLGWFNDAAATAIRWTVEALGEDRVEWLAGLPERKVYEAALLVHASPRDPIYEYVLDGATAEANLRLLGESICFHGHSHVPGVFARRGDWPRHAYDLTAFQLTGPCLVNPGSVGQPRDGDPDASYGVWDLEQGTFTFRRVGYDVAGAQLAIRAAGLPGRFAERLQYGR